MAIKMVEVIKKEYQTVVVDTINELPPLGTASDVIYDDAGTPSNVQAALDELFSEKHTHANKAILDATEQPFTNADKNKLDSFNDEAEYVEITRNIFTTNGIAGGGTLASDRNLQLSLKDIPEDPRPFIDAVGDFVITVDAAGNQYKTKIGGLPFQGATRLIAYVTPPLDNSTTYFDVVDGVLESPPTENTQIVQGVAPTTESDVFDNVDGYAFIVRLPDELKQSGFLSEITGTPNLVFDEDQFIWSSEKGQWVQLEVGDAVISVHGRFGKVVSQVGDYTGKQVMMADGSGNPTAITVQSEIEVRAKTNGQEIIDGLWTFRAPLRYEETTVLPTTPIDGQTVYYSNGVDNKFLVMYKVLSTMPTPGVDGWYKVSDDTLLVI